MSESDLQKAIHKTLKQLNIEFYHCSSKAARVCKTLKDMPDIIMFHKGRSFALELKSKGGTLSPGQKRALQKLHQHGVFTRVIFTYDGFMDFLKEYHIIRT